MINWHFPREELAQRYMDAFSTGITGALALFAPRRMGKTEFALLDLAPEAEKRGYQVGYCSFWNLKDNPAKAFRLTLESIGKQGLWQDIWSSYSNQTSSEVSANISGASFKLKTESAPAEEDDLVAIIDQLSKLARKRKPTLFILDEVQHLADERHASFVATLRTQFDQHRAKLHVIYTGSSRDGLQRMFRDRKTPMFHAAQQVDFPHLDSEFIAFMLNAFEQASKRKLPLAPAIRIFKQLNHNPSLFHHLLRHMVIAGIWDIEKGFEHFNELIDVNADYSELWEQCKAIDKAVLKHFVDDGKTGVYTDEFRQTLAEELGLESVSPKTVQLSIERLRNNQIIFKIDRGDWIFEDPSFAKWIDENSK